MTLDVTKAIEPKSDQQNADDYLAGPETVKIESVEIKSTNEQPVWIHLHGKKGRPWKPSKTALRCLALVWGADANKWTGLSLTLYNDESVTWAGVAVGGIRVSHMEGITKPVTLQLTKTRGKKAVTVIKPLIMPDAPTIDHGPAQEEAREAARGGRDSFTEWWKNNADKRESATLIIEELKQLSKEADDANADGK